MTADHLLAEDGVSRHRALEPESFIVEAPAGAGKTELLTQRYLRLLAEVDEPEEVVALTFTRKAAGEMLDRIMGSFELARSETLPDEPHRQLTQDLGRRALARGEHRGWSLAANPQRLRVMTLDALCAGIARQMPLLSRFGSQPALAEDAGVHYAEAARRTLELLEAPGEHGDAIDTVLRYLDNDGPRLERLLAQMLARREQWGRQAHVSAIGDQIAVAFEAVIDSEIASIAKVLDREWQSALMPSIRFAAANSGDDLLSGWTDALPSTAAVLPLWRRLAGYCLTAGGDPRLRLTKAEGFPPGDEHKARKDAFQALLRGLTTAQVDALRNVRELPVIDSAGSAKATRILEALATVLRLATAQLWLVFRERREVDFVELALRSIAALGDEDDPTELGRRLDYRIRHLLVDEFQDTSPTQVELLCKLTAGWQAGDGRTLFLVGDPMQSIYRFRKADVGLFLQVREHGIGGLRLTPLQLRRNNRSCPEVVDWINREFPAVLAPVDNPVAGEVRYREFAATRAPLADAGVFLHPVACEKGVGAGIVSDLEAARVLAILQQVRAADAGRKVTILVRARDHLRTLVASLRKLGFRYSAVEIDPLQERQVVQDLISLTRALHHRADRVHWLAILRAPWCGLTLADLHALVADQPHATVWSLLADEMRLSRLSADGRSRASALVSVLGPVLNGQGRQLRRRWVEDAWRLLGGPVCLQDPADLDDATAYFDRLGELDAAGRFDLDRLEDDMRRLYAAPDASAGDSLQLMTIHKAKGLEFDTVIVMGLHRPPASGDTPLLAWDQVLVGDEERLLAAPMNPRGRDEKEGPTAFDFLQRLERRRNRNEESRLLYVAATRAIRTLHWVGAVTMDAGRPVEPRADSLLAQLWPAFAASLAAGSGTGRQVTTDGSGEEPVNIRPSLADFIPQLVRRREPPEPLSGLTPPAAAFDPNSWFSQDDEGDAFAAAIGTLAHACLEQAASSNTQWTAPLLPGKASALASWFRVRGWSPDEAGEGARAVLELLRTTLESADGCWVLKPRDTSQAELALTKLGADGTAQTRVMDRSFVEAGTRWIIDYKSARGLVPSELAVHAERYRPQLARYATLFAQEQLPVRTAVFYLAHGRLIELH